jgi:hypothetical protein
MKNSKAIKTPNQIARTARMNHATTITVGDDSRVLSTTPYGYRKYTTGEYVSNKYRANFGWKNTYYQHAECSVLVNIENFY